MRVFHRCIVAGANLPTSAELTAKAFKPLLSATPTPERALVLKTLAKALGANSDAPPRPSALAKALGACGALGSVAECLQNSPGQESAARCTYFAARTDIHAARVLADGAASTLLLPLLTAPDDGLQQWAAAALAPVLAGDPFRASKSVIEAGGVFTVVALLSSSSSDVRSHALAALISLCSAIIGDAWPKSGCGSEEAKRLLERLVDGAIDAGICRSISPLLQVRSDARVATAALEAISALSYVSKSFRYVLRREIYGDSRFTTELVAACSNQDLGAHVLRTLADACYCVDERTGVENRSESTAAADAAKGLYAAGVLSVAIDAVGTELDTSVNLGRSLLLEACARKGAEDRSYTSPGNSRRDDGVRIAAALLAHAPGAADDWLTSGQTRMLTALVSAVAFELAPSLTVREGQPRAMAALPALNLCVSAGARQHDARPAIEAAQAGILDLLATHNFFDTNLVYALDHAPSRGLVAARAAMLVHSSIEACWRDSNESALLVLVLAAPPNSHILSRLCGLLDGLASSGLALSEERLPSSEIVDSLTTATLLALGSLCGAARPFGRVEHPSEQLCRRDVALSLSCGLAIAAGLSLSSTGDKRRAAARLLAALLRSDSEQPGFDDEYSQKPRNAIAESLAQAGLVGIVANCLSDDDAILRADAIDAFAALFAHAPSEDPDVARGTAALGDALARGLVASDATLKHSTSGCTEDLVRYRATMAVERALCTLGAVCCHGNDTARDAVAFSADCSGAFISLMRAPLSVSSDFCVRCARICLSAIIALASGAQGRATALASAGACDAIAAVFVASMRDTDGCLTKIVNPALSAIATISAFDEPRRVFVATEAPILAALFLAVARVCDGPSFERGSIALSTLRQIAHPTISTTEPRTAIKLATAAKRAKAVAALTHVLNSGWRAFCIDAAQNDVMIQSAHQVITALANAPAIAENPIDDDDDAIGNDDPLAMLVDHRPTGVSSAIPIDYNRALDKDMLINPTLLPISTDRMAGHEIKTFEQRYSAFLKSPEAGNGLNTKHNNATLGDVDVAALVSLINAPVPFDNAEHIIAHVSAVDRACGALQNLIAKDASGAAATLAIQSGVLTSLLGLAPRSSAAAMCLVALCEVGELHRPLMLAVPTPTVTMKFIDTIISMLCAVPLSTSRVDSELPIVRAAVQFMNTVCRDSDLAVLALAVTLAARNELSTAIVRLSTIAIAEASVESMPSDDMAMLPGTLVLVSMLAPLMHDALDNYDDLCSVDCLGVPEKASLSLPEFLGSLLETLAIDTAVANSCNKYFTCEFKATGIIPILDASAINAVARAAPALFRTLLVLPPGSLRARARRIIAAIARKNAEATRFLLGAGAVEAAVRLVIEAKANPGKTAASDAALGLTLLTSLVCNEKDRAARAALAHDGLLPALVTYIVQATKASEIDPLACAALSLLVNLASAGDDATAYVISRRDLLEALVTVSQGIIPTSKIDKHAVLQTETDAIDHGEGTARHVTVSDECVDAPSKRDRQIRIYMAEKALLALANTFLGPLSQRKKVAEVNGIFDVAIGTLRVAKGGTAQAVAARLCAAILETRTMTDIEGHIAASAVSNLCDAIVTAAKAESNEDVPLEAALYLVRALDALSFYKQGAVALRSPQTISALSILLKKTIARHPDIAEVGRHSQIPQKR